VSIKVVANTKGGVGKSVISAMVMPFIVDNKDIVIHEFDNNNQTKIENTSLKFNTIKADKSGDKIDEILFDVISEKKVSHIIDCGGGNDTIKVLDFLIESDLIGLEYYIPVNSDIEQAKNLIDTIKEIKKRDKEATINVILNRCYSLDEDTIKEQFVGIFGSETYDVAGVIDEVLKDTKNIYFLKDTQLFGILKNIHNTTLFDVYQEAKDIHKNIAKYKKEWIKTGEKEFKTKMKHYKFLKEVIRFVEQDLKTFRT
jgi:hypothetical protein